MYSPQRGDVSAVTYKLEAPQLYSPQRGDVSLSLSNYMLVEKYSPQRGDVSKQAQLKADQAWVFPTTWGCFYKIEKSVISC